MSPADNEPSFAVKQRTVQRKLGRCLIRLQQVELLVTRVRQFASKNPCFLPRTPSIYAGFKPIFVNPCNGTFVVYGLNESIT